MTAPRPSGRDDATLRGAVVLIVAIVIGIALLARSGGGGGSDDAASDSTSTTSTTVFDGSTTASDTAAPINSESTTTSTTGPADTRPPEEVTVIVLNGTSANVEGAAADSEANLGQAGYVTLDATGATEDLPTTTIYAAPEFAADAEAIKGVLGISTAVIADRPGDALSDSGADASADVVVVLGDDIS